MSAHRFFTRIPCDGIVIREPVQKVCASFEWNVCRRLRLVGTPQRDDLHDEERCGLAHKEPKEWGKMAHWTRVHLSPHDSWQERGIHLDRDLLASKIDFRLAVDVGGTSFDQVRSHGERIKHWTDRLIVTVKRAILGLS